MKLVGIFGCLFLLITFKSVVEESGCVGSQQDDLKLYMCLRPEDEARCTSLMSIIESQSIV